MKTSKDYWLIIAHCARMLVQLACREGYRVIAIDTFADTDTLALAWQTIKVPSLHIIHLSNALKQLAVPMSDIVGVIYGSGFEAFLPSLFYLEKRFYLYGNHAHIFARIQNKHIFFHALKILDIAHPLTLFSLPNKTNLSPKNTWLSKSFQSHGGMGIQRFRYHSSFTHNKTMNVHQTYWQLWIEGQAKSVLFLADDFKVKVIGFHHQSYQRLGQYEFAFSGIHIDNELSIQQQKQLQLSIEKLVAYFQLRGIGSLDFIENSQGLFILEINARPPASMQLYAPPIWHLFLQACQHRLPNHLSIQPCYTHYQLLFAPKSLVIASNTHWPENSQNLPSKGVVIGKYQPICSMIAHSSSLLKLKLNQLERNLFMNDENKISVNTLAAPIVEMLINHANKYRVGILQLENGCQIIDAGLEHRGGLEAGRLIAQICLGGMGEVTINQAPLALRWPLTVHVHTSNPVLACLGSQYAGWSLSHEKYYALGSGPARAMATKIKDGQSEPVEELYKELGYHDSAEKAVLVIENDAIPPLALVEKVANACGIAPERLTIIVTPTSSLAGGVQVVARVLEVAMHKAHALNFPLEHILDGSGSAPICPPHPNFVKAMGRTNDAILFAGHVHLFVKGSDEAAENLAQALPSSTSKDYGKPFADIFKAYEYDFFKIDAMLFSPARVMVTAVDSGKTFCAGQLDNELLNHSFGV